MVLKFVQAAVEELKATRGPNVLQDVQNDIDELVKPVQDCVATLNDFVEQQLKSKRL